MSRKKSNSKYVTRAECFQISGRISSELAALKKALVGEDMRSGVVKDIADLKSDVKEIKSYIDNQKTKGRDWRLLGFSILASITGGTVVAIITHFLHNI
jgi:hypothetical protein